MTKEQAQEEMYKIREERDFLSLLEKQIDNRQQLLLEKSRVLLYEHCTLILQPRPVLKETA